MDFAAPVQTATSFPSTTFHNGVVHKARAARPRRRRRQLVSVWVDVEQPQPAEAGAGVDGRDRERAVDLYIAADVLPAARTTDAAQGYEGLGGPLCEVACPRVRG